jgi:dihydropyrimidinase
MAGRTLIRGGTLIDAAGVRRGDVLVDGERIAAVGPDLGVDAGERPGTATIDASGAFVIPGAIDVHTHFDLPVGAVRSADDFASGTLAAACGGTTCVVDFAGGGRETPEDALSAWHAKAAGRAVIDFGFHLTVTSVPEEPDEARALFEGFVEQGVTSVKLYMAYPERLMVDDGTLARAFAAGRDAGVRICVHAEDGAEVERLTTEALRVGPGGPSTNPIVRPPSVEAAAIRRAAALASAARTSVYVVHLSSVAGHSAVMDARAAGVDIRAETCPHYLHLTADVLRGPVEEAQDFVCAPPLREPEDRAALWRALGDGSIDVISTDHCPFTMADRRHGTADRPGGWATFAQIPGGLPGVETRLSLAYQGVADGRLTLERWVDAVAGAPARLFGLDASKGSLREGCEADIVVFDPAATRRLDATLLHSRSDHSPYQGMDITGWAAVTFARGRIVARDGEPFDAELGRGRFVRRLPMPL